MHDLGTLGGSRSNGYGVNASGQVSGTSEITEGVYHAFLFADGGMAQANRGWGYTRIQGALANLDHKVGRGTIANVLQRNVIEPSPERSRRTSWSTFL